MIIKTNSTVQLSSLTVNHIDYQGGCSGWPLPTSVNATFSIPEISFSQTFSVGCASTTNIPLNVVLPTGKTYTLITSETFQTSTTIGTSSTSGNEVTISMPGAGAPFYNLLFVKSNSCDPIPVNIPLKSCCTNIKPTASGSNVCQNTALSVSVNGNGAVSPTFHWKGPNGFSKDTTATTVKVSSSATTAMQGWYSVYTTTAACGSPSQADSVLITINTPPASTVITDKSAICKDQATATLSITGCTGCTYSWSNGLGTNASATISPASTTTYTITYTGSNTCSASANVAVTVNIPASIAATVNPSAICVGQASATLNVTGCTGCTSYSWDNNAGNSASAIVSPTTSTTYTVLPVISH